MSVSGPASDVGVRVLMRGGNAVDAAVAAAFALAVTFPAAGNIGGGGYMLIVPSRAGVGPVVIDARETAPAAATRDMFVRPEDRTPHRLVGVPGSVRGLALAHQRFGRLAWGELVGPAVALARDGFALDAHGARSLNDVLKRSDRSTFAELHRVFGKPGGGPWRAGDRLVQADLAATLQAIADRGPDGFYTGPTADRLVDEMGRGGGLISKDDLTSYRAMARAPVRGSYRGVTVLSSPPSSSGGTTLVEMLNVLETFDLKAMGRWSAECLGVMIEAMKRAYRDRALLLGDPDRVAVPEDLTAKGYARRLAADIRPGRVTPSLALAGEVPIFEEGEHTTHLSVVDADRTSVSFTTTLEESYGGRVVVRGAGFLLNNEMNDFNWVPGVTDRGGRIGTVPNRVEPGKRMLSSMCPTVLLRDGKPWLVTGSPGGRTIINTVLGIVVNVVDFGMTPRAAVDAPRIHHQWLPDRVRVESALAREHPATMRRLHAMGYALEARSTQGDAHTILIDPVTGEILAAEDRRVSGKASAY